ncbi:tRNA lysidine(34) synthetase TilS [Burkholderia sp. WAC0059]|uniref:tRNA lysidine(34) synthetase TilS n=1 Tax=Burkholderia sp. WAC0059 TaxID=2066022 RepID=UPI000C7F4871|nr:tRNA lysidine(34) synthetase TilS [Burkholderia sp. WAC0059]PLZ02706.1 tRNA lysidine(34) synthetase TilS [Burkholderia sp. WAC0059]
MTSPADSTGERIVLDALAAALFALPSDGHIALACSGGLDSSVLLDAAVRVAGPARCVVLHVHHGLSPNADRWLAHCEAAADALGVSFGARRVAVAQNSGLGVEAAARDARYRALDALCAEYGVRSLWLAQHADDQAETVLLQLLRGAGMAGLAAMAPVHGRPGGVLRVRPFLHLLRAQLERYAVARALHWVDDESNADTRYARNALRQNVMPTLAAHFPGYRDALARAAAHAASAQQLLDALAQLDLREAACDDDGEALERDALLALDEARALNLMRYWMRALGLPAASAARLNDALRQLRDVGDANGDHRLRVDHAGRRLRCYRGRVFWQTAGARRDDEDREADVPAARESATLDWRGEAVWRLPQWRGTFVFAPSNADDPDAVPEALLMRAPLVARTRTGGERMRNATAGGSHTLKNLFQTFGVPAWERDVPLLFSGDALLFVPRIGLNRAALAADRGDDGRAEVAGAARWRRIEWRADLLIA